MTISLVEVYTKVREICHFGLSKVPKGLTGAFYGREKVEKTFWFCDLCIFKRQPHLTPVNRDVKFRSKYVKGVPFVPCERGTFSVKNVFFLEELDLWAVPSRLKLC